MFVVVHFLCVITTLKKGGSIIQFNSYCAGSVQFILYLSFRAQVRN